MSQTHGYSGTPLPKKLGFKPGFVVGLIDPPPSYDNLLSEAAEVRFETAVPAPISRYDAVHAFLNYPEFIVGTAAAGIGALREGGMLWLSWAKKSSPLHVGITEDDLRTHVLPLGWVDVKVCAVDADWSGLKFLKRKT